jgi:hypothetical protein
MEGRDWISCQWRAEIENPVNGGQRLKILWLEGSIENPVFERQDWKSCDWSAGLKILSMEGRIKHTVIRGQDWKSCDMRAELKILW